MTKRIVLFFICFLVAADLLAVPIYVSSSSGDDNNNGLTADKPVRTIRNAMTKGTDIILKAGDVFHESGLETYGRSFSRYGKGINPVISGYKRIVKPDWQPLGGNIWRISLASDNYSGVRTGESILNNIGCLHEYDKDIIHGRRVEKRSDLKSDWDFWQTGHYSLNTPASEFNYLYLYSSTNPNTLKLEFSVGARAMVTNHAVIDGVDFVGYGFGISAFENTVIRHCRIDAVGGMVALGADHFECFGNGIEFYVSHDINDCIVEECHITRCYDCGITIQGSDCGQATPKNILIRKNLVEYCCQGFEEFLRNDSDIRFVNCVFEENIVLCSGKSGFGYSDGRFKFCHILSNDFTGERGMIVRDNVFAGGNFYCSGAYSGKYRSIVWDGNICYVNDNDFILSNYTGTADVVRGVSSRTNLEKYRSLTEDRNTVFVSCTPQRIEKIIERQRRHASFR